MNEVIKHIVLNVDGRPYQAGDEVQVCNSEHSLYKQCGEVFKVRNYNNSPRISVSFDGEVYGFQPTDIELY